MQNVVVQQQNGCIGKVFKLGKQHYCPVICDPVAAFWQFCDAGLELQSRPKTHFESPLHARLELTPALDSPRNPIQSSLPAFMET